MTEEQRARWLALLPAVQQQEPFFILKRETYLSICATITAEAVAAERKRCADILNAARSGVIGGDLRCIRSWIESGEITS